MTNDKIQMTKEIQTTNDQTRNMKFDLEERTLDFAKRCIDLCKGLTKDNINFELTNQIIRSASSVGANYCEANEAFSKKDFYHRINICRKESKETKYWLELILHSNPLGKHEIEQLMDEAFQLVRIFASISQSKK